MSACVTQSNETILPCASREEKVERVLSTFPLCDRTQIYSSKMASNIDEANVEEKRTENEAGE